jgi:hypothetical protein
MSQIHVVAAISCVVCSLTANAQNTFPASGNVGTGTASPANAPSLSDVKRFVEANKHLPEIPTAKEFEEQGVNLSEMNMALLKKVEELTLYMIRQDERINSLEKQLQPIQK